MKEGEWLVLARDGYRLDKLEDQLKTYGYFMNEEIRHLSVNLYIKLYWHGKIFAEEKN